MYRKLLIAISFALFSTCVASQVAQSEANRVSFDVSASEQVDSDLLVVRLFVQHQAKQQAEASQRVNEAMAWALTEAKKVSVVRTQTLDYRTSPVYQDRNISEWQTRQSLRLESADKDALTQLLGTLQQRLAIESLGYEISPAVRAQVEARLTDGAIQRYRARAREVAHSFGRKGYTIISVNIASQGGAQPPIAYQGRALAMRAEVADPSIESGQQTLSVTINGTIEMTAQ